MPAQLTMRHNAWKLGVTPLAPLLLLLLLKANPCLSRSCVNNNIDLVIAVDTSFTCPDAEFQNLLSQVKGLISGFTIGPNATQVALIGMSETAQLLASFNDISSAVNFNSAVDRLKLTRKPASISAGMRLARESVLNIPKRDARVHRLLILVKDRQCVDLPDTDDAELASMGREAAAVKQMDCTIYAVGVGGLWLTKDLKSIFGLEYLLFKDKNNVKEFTRSLAKLCPQGCMPLGQYRQEGKCFNNVKHVLSVNNEARRTQHGTVGCRQEIVRSFSTCNDAQTCGKTARVVGACAENGTATIKSELQFFNKLTQTCRTIEYSEYATCDEAKQCKSQVADMIILVDQSSSIFGIYTQVIEAAKTLVNSLNIGRDNVRIGVLCFTDEYNTRWIVNLADVRGKDDILKILESRKNLESYYFGTTYTGAALSATKTMLMSQGRPNVPKIVLVITDGESTDPDAVQTIVAELKRIGVTIYAAGVKLPDERLNMDELRLMTSPETDMNLYILHDITDLQKWAANFSQRLCVDLSPTNAKLCEAKVRHRSISACYKKQTQINTIEYMFEADKKCIKNRTNTVLDRCVKVCTDPIDGTQHYEIERWTTLCHEFFCKDDGTVMLPSNPTACVAADLTCKPIGSANFQCRNVDGEIKNNCKCVEKNGAALLIIQWITVNSPDEL